MAAKKEKEAQVPYTIVSLESFTGDRKDPAILQDHVLMKGLGGNVVLLKSVPGNWTADMVIKELRAHVMPNCSGGVPLQIVHDGNFFAGNTQLSTRDWNKAFCWRIKM